MSIVSFDCKISLTVEIIIRSYNMLKDRTHLYRCAVAQQCWHIYMLKIYANIGLNLTTVLLLFRVRGYMFESGHSREVFSLRKASIYVAKMMTLAGGIRS